MTKPTKWHVHPAKTQISLGIRQSRSAWAFAQSDQSSLSAWILWSDWAAAQADPSLQWAHSHFVGFVMKRLISVIPNQKELLFRVRVDRFTKYWCLLTVAQLYCYIHDKICLLYIFYTINSFLWEIYFAIYFIYVCVFYMLLFCNMLISIFSWIFIARLGAVTYEQNRMNKIKDWDWIFFFVLN